MENQNKKYDLEERTALFAERVRDFCLKLPKNVANNEYAVQLIRSGSSPGANYIEANESLSKKDFTMWIKISRKEVKESRYWLNLIDVQDENLNKEKNELIIESTELMNIFGAIIQKIS